MSKLRLISLSPNAKKPGQVTVVFGQKRTGSSSALGMILSAAQGIDNSSVATAVQSFTEEKATEYFGTTSADYKALDFDARPGIENFEAAVGQPLSIAIKESTTKNPARPNQQAKINPRTNAVLTTGGLPIYREGTLVLAGSTDDQDVLVAHDRVAVAPAAPATSAVEQLMTAV